MKMQQIEFGRENFVLHPDRAMYWLSKRTVIVSDPHFGKDSLFRAAGVPVPAGMTPADLLRISALIGQFDPARLLILGDFFHGKASQAEATLEALSRWREAHAHLPITLIRGNHDQHAGDPPAALRIDVVAPSMCECGIEFTHIPPGTLSLPTIAGHVHPCTSLSDYDGGIVRVPCFVVEPMLVLLPAFGRFTGGQSVEQRDGRRVYAAAHQRVVPVR